MSPRAYLTSIADTVSKHRRDAVRLAVQTAAASATAFLIMTGLGLAHMSWAVIAALFTIQTSADSSLSSAAGRLLGTLLGVGIGLAAVGLVGGEGYFLARLAIATAAAGAIGAIWPSLNYVGVAAVVMALHPDPELADALDRAAAIVIGAASGVAATLIVWPEFGARRTIGFIEESLRDTRDVLELTLGSIDTEERWRRDEVHGRFLSNLESARTMAAQSWFAPRLNGGASLSQAVTATERLWHGLVILDRVITDEGKAFDEPAMVALRPHIEEVQRVSCSVADALILILQGQSIMWPKPRLKETVARARDAASDFLERYCRMQDRRSRAIYALIFALDEVERNISEMAAIIVPRPSRTQEVRRDLGGMEARSS